LLSVKEPPDAAGLQVWLQESTGDRLFLIPVRRLQRILTDIRRAREGLFIDALGGSVTIFPHVYAPVDVSVPNMLLAYEDALKGKKALDVGTGTGVMALLAARLGASHVIATDINPNAVANARENAARLGLTEKVEVRGPANLFEAVQEERFDVLMFNPPWMQGKPQTLYDTALYDPGYRVLQGFLRDAPKHLEENGVTLLQYSNISQRKGENGMDTLYAAIDANSLRIVSQRSITRRSRVLGTSERVFLFEIERISSQTP
jgi:methylase of polypeptide subunit release factors